MLDPKTDYIVVLVRKWFSDRGYNLRTVNVIVNGESITDGFVRYTFADSRQIAAKILVDKRVFSTENEAVEFFTNNYARVVFSVVDVERKKDL